LLSPVLGGIVGEEDGDEIDITTPPFRAGTIVAPEALEGTIARLRDRVDAMALALPQHSEYTDLVAFIDPIDGTKEFCTGKGEQCAIMVGLADKDTGQAVAGLVYRPLCPEQSWAMGCARESTFEASLRSGSRDGIGADGDGSSTAAGSGSSGSGGGGGSGRGGGGGGSGGGSFLVSNSGNSAFLDALRADLGYAARPAGGAGNKALLVLEEPSPTVYIQDRGVSRWDTCAPQAVLEAQGGCMVALQPMVAGDESAPPVQARYTYRAGPTNADFVAGAARLTKYNARDGMLSADDLAKGAPPRYAVAADDFKPYANTLGLLALKTATPEAIEAVRAAAVRVAATSPPAYD
jgi:3'-phosphoadenosine 5'-phosphosulfate (PAPS) 3'-phosphatase